jgi:hypothetical protein
MTYELIGTRLIVAGNPVELDHLLIVARMSDLPD